MSRYIDLDSEDCVWCGNPGEYENWNVPLDMPGADVVPAVRCIECKYASFSFHQGELYISCENNEGLFRDVPEDGYCYCGEKVTE